MIKLSLPASLLPQLPPSSQCLEKGRQERDTDVGPFPSEGHRGTGWGTDLHPELRPEPGPCGCHMHSDSVGCWVMVATAGPSRPGNPPAKSQSWPQVRLWTSQQACPSLSSLSAFLAVSPQNYRESQKRQRSELRALGGQTEARRQVLSNPRLQTLRLIRGRSSQGLCPRPHSTPWTHSGKWGFFDEI